MVGSLCTNKIFAKINVLGGAFSGEKPETFCPLPATSLSNEF